jgi:isoamylase
MEQIHCDAIEWATLQVTDENGKDLIDDSFFLIINAAAGAESQIACSAIWTVLVHRSRYRRRGPPFTKAKADDKVVVGGRKSKATKRSFTQLAAPIIV